METMAFDDLSTLKDDMVAFIAGHGLRRMNAFVPEDVPTVAFEDDDLDSWKDFVEHAKAANTPFITMNSVLLEPEDVATLIGQLRDASYPDPEASELEEAQALMRHVGKTGYLQLGFPHGGVIFLYETATEWYDRFQNLLDTVQELGGIIVDDHDDE
jgi:ABC-type sugar transport system substrate-binding protein